MKTFQEFLDESMTPSAFIKHHKAAIEMHDGKAAGDSNSLHHDAVEAHQIALEAHVKAKKNPQQSAYSTIAWNESGKANEVSAKANKSTT